MAGTSRRAFLAMTGSSAFAVGAVGITQEAEARISDIDESDSYDPDDVSAALVVAYLHDARSGVITVVSGDKEATIVDKRLAAKLAKLVKKVD